MRSIAIVLMVCLPVSAQQPGWSHDVLESGTDVTVLQVPDASMQTTFVFLPIGLTADAPHRAQFSHLLEHMLIRMRDADGLEENGIRFNGETTALALRLETMAPAEQWRRSIAKHAAWLAVREFDEDVLAVEKGRIAGEEASTVSRGYTHKWAFAGWNQIVNHGLEHAAVHGDVASAEIEQVAAFARSALRRSHLRVFSVGPVEPEKVVAAVRDELGGFASPAREPLAAAAEPARGAVIEATWDLDRTHLLQWYGVPCGSAADRAAAWVAANQLNMLAQGEARLRRLGAVALASADYQGTHSLAVGVSVSLPEGVDVDEVRDILVSLEGRLPGLAAGSTLLIRQLAAATEKIPDFAPLRLRLGARARFAEANVVLQTAYQAIRVRVPRSEIATAYRAVSAEKLAALYRDHVNAAKRRTLVLRRGE